jgi:ribosomal protein S12 methylthiotransferase accessory factor
MPDSGRSSRRDELLTLVSPRVGVIRSLDRVQCAIEQPDPPVIYRAVLAHFDFKPASPLDQSAIGKGETAEEAMAAAIGEAVKLYCASHPDPERMLLATYKELGSRAFSPAELVLHSEAQYGSEGFPFARFDEDAPLTWMPARSVADGSEIHVPASFVYMKHTYRGPAEYLTDPTSSGLAFGPDLPTAILGGLFELVGGDAFLIHWVNRLPAPRVDLIGLGGVCGSIIEHFSRFDVDVFAFNLTTDLRIPVMMGLAIDRSGRAPAAAVGLGCRPNPAEALGESLMDMCRAYGAGSGRAGHRPQKALALSREDVREPDDHGTLFSGEQALDELDFLLEGDRVQRIEDLPPGPPGDLDAYAGLMARAGHRVVYVDVTTPDIRTLNLRVVRTLAAGLQPLHFGYGRERRGGNRLYAVPRILGYFDRVRAESELSSCPHPLA